MMSVPSWYELVILALAAFRCWKIIGDDAIFDRPRDWLIRILRAGLGKKFELLIVCPWCMGTYVSLSWWGAWQVWPHGTLVVASVFAIMALVGILGSRAVE